MDVNLPSRDVSDLAAWRGLRPEARPQPIHAMARGGEQIIRRAYRPETFDNGVTVRRSDTDATLNRLILKRPEISRPQLLNELSGLRAGVVVLERASISLRIL